MGLHVPGLVPAFLHKRRINRHFRAKPIETQKSLSFKATGSVIEKIEETR